MKQLLVAIDFSKCAVRALQYAVNMVKKIDGELIMVWVDNMKSNESVFPLGERVNRKEIVESFEELIATYAGDLKGKITYKIRKGKVHDEICNQAKYSDVDLILAGTHGITGFEEFWVGSNSYRIVTHAPVPVITIRANYQFRDNISKIVLPVDSTLETRQKVPFTARLARMFQSEVHVLSLYSSNISALKRRVDSYSRQVIKFLEEEKIMYQHEKISAKNITNATIDYAEKEKMDLIAIMTEQETTTANLFLGAFARQMINHSEIPVLSVHSKEFIISSSR